MAFKKITQSVEIVESPDALFRDLPRRKFPDVLPHQKFMMQQYSTAAVTDKDIALQLPTGSGKTLVALLIAEWRRRKFKEKILYLCPTKQLVHQVVNQAEEKYGLSVVGFTGSKRHYDPKDVAKYQLGECVAITTYNSLFNTNPHFHDADIIIIDDAHAAENYVTEFWSLHIRRFNEEHKALHSALSILLKPHIDALSYTRLTGQWDSPTDKNWVDKLSSPLLIDLHDQICEILDAYTEILDIRYPWSLLRDHLKSCHIYLSATEILIRPLIAPTWTHAAFNNPKQRIYLSATLGEGGDLERLWGKAHIKRLPIPDGWNMQGVGRRFFIFPELSFDQKESIELRRELLKLSSRSLFLVPNDAMKGDIVEDIQKNLALKTFTVEDIEHSKNSFVQTENATAIIANRYDGIDFPGDECRLLFIEGLPKTINAQERFLMSRMGANTLFNERIQTRVLQAIGRCTRSLEDYSAIIVTGDELSDYLIDIRRRKYLHPELQSELYFGIEQSKDMTIMDCVENLKIFLDNSKDWEEANQMIVEYRKQVEQEELPSISQLESIVRYEIKYQIALWKNDYKDALNAAEKILGLITEPNLAGYRALWEYLAGSAAYLEAGTDESYNIKSHLHFNRAKNAAKDLPWLSNLSRYTSQQKLESEDQANLYRMQQVEQIEAMLDALGTTHDRAFAKQEQNILEGLIGNGDFENAQKMLGEHLGFYAGKIESEGSPDPWWQCGDICLVFEDHANAEATSSLDITKARQAASHPQWIRDNVVSCQNITNIMSVLVTPVSTAYPGTLTHLNNVALWSLPDFIQWAQDAMGVIRELRNNYITRNDMMWRIYAAEVIQEKNIDIMGIYSFLKTQPAKELLHER